MRKIKNIRLPQPLNNLEKDVFWSIALDESNIVRSLYQTETDPLGIGEDWNGDWLSPMGIDLQINGGLGIAFNDLHLEKLPKLNDLLEQLWSDGIDSICPTIVTSSVASLRESLQVIRIARNVKRNQSCQLLGAHLEGPFLSKEFKGAHDLEHLAHPSLIEIDKRIQGFQEEISLVTLAPELDGATGVIQKLKDLEIVISLGHSSASSEEAKLAYKQGVSMITHAFNAMPGIHHRNPGPIGEAITNGSICLGLIADGVHINPQIALIIAKLLPDKIFLVSDALSGYGLEKMEFVWNKQLVRVNKGTCRLEDGTLAGTTLSLLDGCKRFAKWSGNFSAAIWCATVSPRYAIKQGDQIHEFLIGKPLRNLLRWTLHKDSFELLWSHAE